LLSLGAIDDHRFGRRDNWSQCADRLLTERMISAQAAQELVLLDAFGALIANTDRHFGNISLFIDDFPYSLAPAYDMLSMLYRPTEGGVVLLADLAFTARNLLSVS
jgi:serine/threonine protein kinase HipA of HipAB toxin-antitoxin module